MDIFLKMLPLIAPISIVVLALCVGQLWQGVEFAKEKQGRKSIHRLGADYRKKFYKDAVFSKKDVKGKLDYYSVCVVSEIVSYKIYILHNKKLREIDTNSIKKDQTIIVNNSIDKVKSIMSYVDMIKKSVVNYEERKMKNMEKEELAKWQSEQWNGDVYEDEKEEVEI